MTATTPNAATVAKAAEDRRDWTVAYRKRGANRFLRVDGLDLTWSQATELANRLTATDSKLQVFTVGTRAAEDAGRVPEEDVANVLVDSGRRKSRVRIKEGGELPADVEPPLSPAAARFKVLGDEDAPPASEVAEEQPAVQANADEPVEATEEPAEEQPAAEVTWTVAYRAPRAKRFRRVPDMSLTERDAKALAQRFANQHPEVEVYATWTRQAEKDGLVAAEDRGILTTEDGAKIKMIDAGVLPRIDGDDDQPAIRKHKAPKAAPKPGAKAKADAKADAKTDAKAAPKAPKAAAPKAAAKAPKAKPVPAPTVADGITVTRVTEGGKRDLVATDAKGKVIGTAVGYNERKPNGSMWFKGWKIMDASGKKQVGHVVFQVGVAKAEAKLRELVAA